MANKTSDLQLASEKPFVIFQTQEDFRRWFLETYDFSEFSDESIEMFFQEASPAQYPCIPYYGDEKSIHPTAYLSVALLQYWISQLPD